MARVALSHMEPFDGFGGYGADYLSHLTLTPVRTVRRWLHERRAPRAIVALLALRLSGALDTLSNAWMGWSLRAELLYSPSGTAFTRGEIESIPIRAQQLAALELEIKRLTERLAAAHETARTRETPALANPPTTSAALSFSCHVSYSYPSLHTEPETRRSPRALHQLPLESGARLN